MNSSASYTRRRSAPHCRVNVMARCHSYCSRLAAVMFLANFMHVTNIVRYKYSGATAY